MFKSYEYLDHCGYVWSHDGKTKIVKILYKIVDDEFEEETIITVEVDSKADSEVELEVAIAVIDVYERRNLNVAANLALAFKYIDFECFSYISIIIAQNKKHNPKYLPYAEEVEKYLIWM